MQPKTITIDPTDSTVRHAVAQLAKTFLMEPDVAQIALMRFIENVIEEILEDPEWHCDSPDSNHRYDWSRIAGEVGVEKEQRRGPWVGTEAPAALPLTQGEVAFKVGELLAGRSAMVHPAHVTQLCIALVLIDEELANTYLAYKSIIGNNNPFAYLVAPVDLEGALESSNPQWSIDLIGRVYDAAPRALRGPCCTMADPCDASDPCPDHVEAAELFLGTQVATLGDTALPSTAVLPCPCGATPGTLCHDCTQIAS